MCTVEETFHIIELTFLKKLAKRLNTVSGFFIYIYNKDSLSFKQKLTACTSSRVS